MPPNNLLGHEPLPNLTASTSTCPAHRRTRLAYAPAHLIDLAAETGKHPLRHLQEAASGRDLSTAGDMAAVLYWRLPALPTPEAGPLPWLPHVPHAIQDYPAWGNYLAKRATRRRPRRPDSRPRNPSRRSAGLGSTGKPPEHRTERRHSRVAGRPRHRPTRPTANWRAPTRGCRGPMRQDLDGDVACRHRAAQLQRRSATGTT